MITKTQIKKMQENGKLNDLVHFLKTNEANGICNQKANAKINFCVASGMTHGQIVACCGLKPLKCNNFITDGLTNLKGPTPPASNQQLINMLTEILNSVETEGCDGCGTVDIKVINKGRRFLGWSEL
ncbi:MAG: hypothetical protein WC375_00110 [Methanomassiliicoccales archaeon]|jgi:hypothetical protein